MPNLIPPGTSEPGRMMSLPACLASAERFDLRLGDVLRSHPGPELADVLPLDLVFVSSGRHWIEPYQDAPDRGGLSLGVVGRADDACEDLPVRETDGHCLL